MSEEEQELVKLKIQEESDLNRAIAILRGITPTPATEMVIQLWVLSILLRFR